MHISAVYVSKSFRTGRLQRVLRMVQLSATTRSCIAIMWVSLISFAAIILYVAYQRVITKVSLNFVIDSVRKIVIHPRKPHSFEQDYTLTAGMEYDLIYNMYQTELWEQLFSDDRV
jgi:hypothetical protein